MDHLSKSIKSLSVSKTTETSRIGQSLLHKQGGDGQNTHTLIHKAPGYASTLLANLASLWKCDTFCDVNIVVEDQSLAAHRHVLAASSPFFMAMFTSGMAEQIQDQITMHEVDPEIFRVALLFMYTG